MKRLPEIFGAHIGPSRGHTRSLGIAALIVILSGTAAAQVTLTGTSYVQDFNGLGGALPTGWSVTTAATANSLGTSASFQSAPTNWSASLSTEPRSFRNIASNNIASGANAATQSADSDRALGWRPGDAASRNGAVTLAIANTTGFTNFNVSISLFSPNNVSNDQTYAFEYRVGNSGAFTQLGSTYTTGTVFGAATITANSITLSALNDQHSPVYFRIRGAASSGTSSSGLDVLGIDSFNLSFSGTSIPEPATNAVVVGLIIFAGAMVRRRCRIKKPVAPTRA
ncbi:MAG TPA: hypothetical protein VG710_01995 [Opitutus sp.]|nr:hypothetical protein [Opitutus sp.]